MRELLVPILVGITRRVSRDLRTDVHDRTIALADGRDATYPSVLVHKESVMESTLVTELRSLTATALTATSAAERGAWDEAHRAVSDLNARTQRVLRLLVSTHDELKGKGDSREFFPRPTAGSAGHKELSRLFFV